MEFPHILLSLPKWWPSSGNREETVPLPPSPQSPSEALRFTREPILDSSGTPRPSCMNQQTWAAGGMGRGCRAPPPSLLGCPPQEDSTSHNLPYQVCEQLPPYPSWGVTKHRTSAPSGAGKKIPPTAMPVKSLRGFMGQDIALSCRKPDQPLWECTPTEAVPHRVSSTSPSWPMRNTTLHGTSAMLDM